MPKQERVLGFSWDAEPAYSGPTYHSRAYDHQNFRGAYNQQSGSSYAAQRTVTGRNTEDFDYGRDRSRPGGEDPSLNPAAN